MDIVGYSRLRPDQQAAVQEELTRLVEDINEVEKARRNAQLIARPTGDGMSLLFFQNLLSPVHTALEIDRLLKRNNPGLKTRIGATIHLRMGIHSGPVMIVRDINGAVDVAGDGIVVAQRVMDAGDAGHILLSGSIVEGLQGIQPWSRFIHPLGE
jgi:class 3 adenylate cyclase